MKDFAKAFYASGAWRSAREAAWKRAGGLCERCLEKGIITPAEIIHHRIALTPSNIHNPRITLSLDNLQAVCRKCHEEIHHTDIHPLRFRHRRYEADELGRVKAID